MTPFNAKDEAKALHAELLRMVGHPEFASQPDVTARLATALQGARDPLERALRYALAVLKHQAEHNNHAWPLAIESAEAALEGRPLPEALGFVSADPRPAPDNLAPSEPGRGSLHPPVALHPAPPLGVQEGGMFLCDHGKQRTYDMRQVVVCTCCGAECGEQRVDARCFECQPGRAAPPKEEE